MFLLYFIKKHSFNALLLVMLLPNYAAAGWVELAADQVAREYVNLETVEAQGNIVSMWNMSDFNEAQPVGNGRTYFSSRVLQEYDCMSKKKRIITLIHYRDPMGQGQLVFYDKTPGQWREVPSGSLGEVHLNAACLTSMHPDTMNDTVTPQSD